MPFGSSVSVVLGCCFACCFSASVVAQVPERHEHPTSASGVGLGEVRFANSGNAAAQEPFLRGLALLHSFEYDEAAEAFRAAQPRIPASPWPSGEKR